MTIICLGRVGESMSNECGLVERGNYELNTLFSLLRRSENELF